jgi:spore coat polysaccharide biosynthesis protein SpsF
MDNKQKINAGIIIQARSGSTRLPDKVLMDFHNGKTILQIIYDNLSANVKLPVVIATTHNKKDNAIEDFCKKHNIKYFRGSENDVLQRFIETAKYFNFTHVIRVCADNPFLSADSVNELYNKLTEQQDSDYISFMVSGKPSILTHYGFWAELVSLNALKKANDSDSEFYHEHVTNYIYNNPELFKIKWINVGKQIENNNNIRLTVDNIEDFKNAQAIYNLTPDSCNPETIIEIINQNPELKQKMMEQIQHNKK